MLERTLDNLLKINSGDTNSIENSLGVDIRGLCRKYLEQRLLPRLEIIPIPSKRRCLRVNSISTILQHPLFHKLARKTQILLLADCDMVATHMDVVFCMCERARACIEEIVHKGVHDRVCTLSQDECTILEFESEHYMNDKTVPYYEDLLRVSNTRAHTHPVQTIASHAEFSVHTSLVKLSLIADARYIIDTQDAVFARLHRYLVTSGDAVGMIAAQSCSEKFTQSALNSFHAAGAKKSVIFGMRRLEELLNASALPIQPTLRGLHSARADALLARTLSDVCEESGILYAPEIAGPSNHPYVLSFKLKDARTKVRIRSCRVHSPGHIIVTFPEGASEGEIRRTYRTYMEKTVQGLPHAIEHDPEAGILFFESKKSIRKIAGFDAILDVCPDVDISRVVGSDLFWILDNLGIAAVEEFLNREIKKVLGAEGININTRHINLIVARMTRGGGILSNNFTGVHADDSVIQKASFEQATNTFSRACCAYAQDDMRGVSAQIMMGCVAGVGTGTCKLLYEECKAPQERTQEVPACDLAQDEELEYVPAPATPDAPATILEPEFDF
jgi:hypothetical protein